MEIGKKLKNARIEAGLTQEKAAEKIDVSRQTISNWENEKSYPDIILMILLIALNMLLPEGTYYLVIVFCVVIMSSSALLYQIIKRI